MFTTDKSSRPHKVKTGLIHYCSRTFTAVQFPMPPSLQLFFLLCDFSDSEKPPLCLPVSPVTLSLLSTPQPANPLHTEVSLLELLSCVSTQQQRRYHGKEKDSIGEKYTFAIPKNTKRTEKGAKINIDPSQSTFNKS